MVSFRSLGAVLLLLGAAALLPLSVGGARSNPGSYEIAEFQIDDSEARPLDWLRRWSEDLSDPADRFALLSYGWSASEQASIAARVSGTVVPRESFLVSSGKMAPYRHLTKVRLLAELRLRQGLGNSDWPGIEHYIKPRWQTRHLCNAVRLNREWLLSSINCVTPKAEQVGLEAALEATDLAADDVFMAPIDRYVSQPGGYLILLHLGGSRVLPDPGPLHWRETPQPNYERSQLLSWGRPQPRLGLPATLYRHIELVNARPDLCELSAPENNFLCLTREGARLCPGDDGSPVYGVERNGTVTLRGMVALRNDQCVVSGSGALRQLPVIDLAPHRAWIEATIAPAPAARR